MRLLPRCRRCGSKRCKCKPAPPPVQGRDLVSYLRVSSTEQGISGLGLEAQRAAVARYCEQTGQTLAQEFVEVISGKQADRPELAKAVGTCARTGARLVIARIDRLARNVAFVSALMESQVEFVALDCPGANRLTLHILAALAEAEGRAISERTRVALQAARARGVLLGSRRPGHPQMTEAMRALGRAAAARSKHRAAYARTADVLADVLQWRREGLHWQECADRLNAAGRGHWSRGTVWRLVERFPTGGLSRNDR